MLSKGGTSEVIAWVILNTLDTILRTLNISNTICNCLGLHARKVVT